MTGLLVAALINQRLETTLFLLFLLAFLLWLLTQTRKNNND